MQVLRRLLLITCRSGNRPLIVSNLSLSYIRHNDDELEEVSGGNFRDIWGAAEFNVDDRVRYVGQDNSLYKKPGKIGNIEDIPQKQGQPKNPALDMHTYDVIFDHGIGHKKCLASELQKIPQ